jgi:putative addiction module component (TIGR02574 family)
MTRHATNVLKEALSLPEEERTEIVGALLESLEPSAEEDVDTAWRREVAARMAAVDAGEVKTIPWDEVRDEMFARLSARRHG